MTEGGPQPDDPGSTGSTGSTGSSGPRVGGVRPWLGAGLVLLVAVVVALWPRGDETPAGARSPSGPDLAEWRARAALDPCPAADTTAAAPAGPLAEIEVACLGSGETLPLGAALAGRDTLLNVWSHTCQPCRDELPALQEYALRPDAVPVLGVQVDGSPEAGLAMLTALGVQLPSVTDPGGALRAALAAPQVLPLTYVVSPDGGVRMVNPPVVFRTADEVAAVVGTYRAGG